MHVFLIMLALFLFAGSASAQGYCAPHESMIAQLERNYDEQLVAIGFTDSGALLEVLASESGSFTIIVTLPGRLSCARLTGSSWEIVAQLIPGEPA